MYKKFKIEQRNKILTVLLVILLTIFSCLMPLKTFCVNKSDYKIAEDLNQTILDELNHIDFDELNLLVEDFKNNNTNIFSIDNIKNKVYSILSGENAISYENLFASLFSGIVELFLKYLPMLSIIIAIGVIGNLLNGVKSKFNEKSTNTLIHTVCFLSVVTLVIAIISNLASNTGHSITTMVTQMNVMFPILLTLMVGIGANATAGAFQPIVAIMSTYIAKFFDCFILPLFMFSFVFGIISNLSHSIKLDKFGSFISSLFKWSVGLIFTLFFAVFTIQGITAGSFDSVSIRTAKYSIKSYVPIMGGYLSDGMDLILSSTILIKNSIGLVGILMIITTIISPILEILICSLLLKLVSAIMEPMGSTKISNFLSSTSKSITMLSTCLIAIGFMYLISVGLIMTTSNVVM